MCRGRPSAVARFSTPNRASLRSASCDGYFRPNHVNQTRYTKRASSSPNLCSHYRDRSKVHRGKKIDRCTPVRKIFKGVKRRRKIRSSSPRKVSNFKAKVEELPSATNLHSGVGSPTDPRLTEFIAENKLDQCSSTAFDDDLIRKFCQRYPDKSFKESKRERLKDDELRSAIATPKRSKRPLKGTHEFDKDLANPSGKDTEKHFIKIYPTDSGVFYFLPPQDRKKSERKNESTKNHHSDVGSSLNTSKHAKGHRRRRHSLCAQKVASSKPLPRKIKKRHKNAQFRKSSSDGELLYLAYLELMGQSHMHKDTVGKQARNSSKDTKSTYEKQNVSSLGPVTLNYTSQKKAGESTSVIWVPKGTFKKHFPNSAELLSSVEKGKETLNCHELADSYEQIKGIRPFLKSLRKNIRRNINCAAEDASQRPNKSKDSETVNVKDSGPRFVRHMPIFNHAIRQERPLGLYSKTSKPQKIERKGVYFHKHLDDYSDDELATYRSELEQDGINIFGRTVVYHLNRDEPIRYSMAKCCDPIHYAGESDDVTVKATKKLEKQNLDSQLLFNCCYQQSTSENRNSLSKSFILNQSGRHKPYNHVDHTELIYERETDSSSMSTFVTKGSEDVFFEN